MHMMEKEAKKDEIEKGHPYSNLAKEYTLRVSANIYFNQFLNRVKNSQIREDGTDALLNLIDKYVIKGSSFYKSIRRGTLLYRARTIGHDKLYSEYGFNVSKDGIITGYDETNSREAPLGCSTEGRNNISGVSYLYLADNVETACAEVKPTVRQLISIAEFMAMDTIRIIDFSDDSILSDSDNVGDDVLLSALFAKIMQQYYVPVIDSAEYKATQIITDHIRKTGIDGIAYKSFYCEKGKNYTIFNSDRNRFKYNGSRVLMLQSERRTFLDFNDKKVKEAKTLGYASYNQKDADEMTDKIRSELKRNDEKKKKGKA